MNKTLLLTITILLTLPLSGCLDSGSNDSTEVEQPEYLMRSDVAGCMEWDANTSACTQFNESLHQDAIIFITIPEGNSIKIHGMTFGFNMHISCEDGFNGYQYVDDTTMPVMIPTDGSTCTLGNTYGFFGTWGIVYEIVPVTFVETFAIE